jgi:hypothetical protein
MDNEDGCLELTESYGMICRVAVERHLSCAF